MTPDRSRSSFRRLLLLPEGSPYWWVHWLLLVCAVACYTIAWPRWSSVNDTFGWMSLGNLANLTHLFIQLAARRRHPEYFVRAGSNPPTPNPKS